MRNANETKLSSDSKQGAGSYCPDLPTEKMVNAGAKALSECSVIDYTAATLCYEAMISAHQEQ